MVVGQQVIERDGGEWATDAGSGAARLVGNEHLAVDEGEARLPTREAAVQQVAFGAKLDEFVERYQLAHLRDALGVAPRVVLEGEAQPG